MSESDGRWRYHLEGERDLPLSIKYDLKPLWPAIKAHFGADATSAAIVVALYEAALIGRSVSYSRRRDHYTVPTRYGNHLLTYDRVTRAVDALDADRWIHHRRQAPGGRGCQSAMEAKPELVAIVSAILEGRPKLQLLLPRETIILRDENGRLLDYTDRQKIDRMRAKMERINEAVGATEILSHDGDNLGCHMARIFNLDFNRGGRLYGRGASWQNIKSEHRQTITINGETVIELDYKTLHPCVLYARAGAPMPADCYDLGNRWPRELVKEAMLTIINAPNHGKARGSIAHSEKMAGHLLAVGCGSQEADAEAGDLIKAIKAKHRPIARAFHSDAGAGLMRIDSDMAEDVMTDLMLHRGIPTLPVHDSFLVPASKRGELEAAMVQAAHKQGLSGIRVEAK